MGAAIVVLLASNAWFLISSIDSGISVTYRDASLEEKDLALKQTMAILRLDDASRRNKSAVIAAANSVRPNLPTFEKDGYLWVGSVGLKFDADGTFVEARTW